VAGRSHVISKKGCYCMSIEDGKIVVAFNNTDPGWNWIRTECSLPINEWCHIVVRYNASEENVSVFVNAIEVFTRSILGGVGVKKTSLQIGGKIHEDHLCDVLIAEVRIWETALMESQIEKNATLRLRGTEKGLIGYWSLEEGKSNIARDLCKGNNGIVVGDNSWWMEGGEVHIPPSSLSDDLRQLFLAKEGGDVKLIAEGKILPAHKFMLAARSQAFHALFFRGMRESKQEEIVLHDISYGVLCLLVEYFYTDSITITGENVTELLQAADKFQVLRLKALCEDYIIKNIEVENVCHMLEMTDRMGAIQLRNYCFNWIIINFGEVIATEHYVNLEKNLQREINSAASDWHFDKKRKNG